MPSAKPVPSKTHDAPHHDEPQEHSEKQIVIPLTIKVGKGFYSKLPLLVALFFFFSFSLVMFDKSNLKTSDLFDLQRVSFNINKLYSISFIIFLVLIAISIALAIYYSAGIGWLPSLAVLGITLLSSLLVGLLFYPWLVSPFLAFSAVISFCAVAASFSNRLSFPRVWAILSFAMFLLTVLAFLVVFTKVAENKDVHFNLLVDSMLAKAGSSSVSISASALSSSVSKEDFNSVITKETLESVLSENYPGFNSLSQAEKDAVSSSLQSKVVDSAYQNFQKNSGSIAQKVNTAVSSSGSSSLKQQLFSLEEFRLFYNRFALFSGALAAVIVGFFSFFIQILSFAFLFGLKKLLEE